jgi:hypothetical protein
VWCGEAIASRFEAKLLDLGDREGPASCEGDTRCMGSMEAAMAVDTAWREFVENGVLWTSRSSRWAPEDSCLRFLEILDLAGLLRNIA